MTEPTINCPKCKAEIKLTESLAAPIVEATRKQFRQHLDKELAQVREREEVLKRKEDTLTAQQQSLEAQIEARLQKERTRIIEEESKRAKLVLQSDLDERAKEISALQEALTQRDTKLADAQKVQADLLKEKRELEEAKSALALTVEKRVQDELGLVREKAKKEAEDVLSLKLKEREQQISSMQRQIEDLKRKSEQGSQQLQGEVSELELEESLRRAFPHDLIEAIRKGETGADLVQHVRGPNGVSAGTILWEMKRTKNWTDGWLPKLRADQRDAEADVAVIVSHALPKGLESFDLIDDIWVAGHQCAIPVAMALREMLLAVSTTRRAAEGQQTKAELVYQYLTGARFRHRISAIVEQFGEMRRDLDAERRMMMKQWAKREQQIRSVVDSTAGMYGDLQGIAGQNIQEIEGLTVDLLEGPDEAPRKAA